MTPGQVPPTLHRVSERTIERCKAADAEQITGTDVRSFVGLLKVAPDLREGEFQTNRRSMIA